METEVFYTSFLQSSLEGPLDVLVWFAIAITEHEYIFKSLPHLHSGRLVLISIAGVYLSS